MYNFPIGVIADSSQPMPEALRMAARMGLKV